MDWELFKNLVWLRWRLMANQTRRSMGGRVSAVLTIIGLVGACVLALGGCIGGILLGYLMPHLNLASTASVLKAYYVLAGAFLLFWFIGLLSEIQRSETIDIGRLLHLPVNLRDVFVLNYLVSILCLSVAVVMPAMAGLAGGLVRSRGPAMLLLFPLIASFAFMVTAWVYCLRGWLIALMRNERRRRVVIAALTVAFVVGCQLPNLYFQITMPARLDGGARTTRAGPERVTTVLAVAQAVLPPLWLPYGATALGEGRYGPAVWGSLGGFLLGWLALRRAYRSTLRFYHGVAGARPDPRIAAVAAAAPALALAPAPGAVPAAVRRTLLVERRLPGVPDEVAACAVGCFRSLTRAPEVKLALVMNVVMPFVMLLVLFRPGRSPAAGGEMMKPFLATGAVAAAMVFGAWGVLINQFGFDRDGFRTYVLLPVARHRILLGKNLAVLPFCFGFSVLFLGVAAVAFHVPFSAVAAAVFQAVAVTVIYVALGNLTSIFMPYRFAPGSLKPTKMASTTRLAFLVAGLFGPLLVAPAFLPPALGLLCAKMGWLPGALVNFAISVVLAGVCLLAYGLTLRPLGRLLQARERSILDAVTTEVE